MSENRTGNYAQKGGETVEKRKEYPEGEPIDCPKCGSDDLDYDEAPNHARCNSCEQTFTIRAVLIWEE